LLCRLFVQDTVVALQALAEFASLTYGQNGPEQLSLSLTAGDLTHNFQTITSVNSLVLQSVEVQQQIFAWF
jgi:hypothetical protein